MKWRKMLVRNVLEKAQAYWQVRRAFLRDVAAQQIVRFRHQESLNSGFNLGDRLRWFVGKEAFLEPNTYFNYYLNLGLPSFQTVYSFDQVEYFPQGEGRCHRCEHEIGGVAAKIVDGVFEDIVVFDQAKIDDYFGANDRESETLVNCRDTLVPYHFPDHFPRVLLEDPSDVTLQPVPPEPGSLRIDPTV